MRTVIKYQTGKPRAKSDGFTYVEIINGKKTCFTKAEVEAFEDPVVIVKDYVGSDMEADDLARRVSRENFDKLEEIKVLEGQALRSLIAYTLDPSNQEERAFLVAKRDAITVLRNSLNNI